MEFIKPAEIAGKIMTLIDDSDSHVVLVSPYVKIGKWYKLKNRITSAIERGIRVEFFIREDDQNEQSVGEVSEIGITPTLVSNLHCKLYFNEKHAIITSMNLLLSSEINSLEIAYMTETESEYAQVMDFYNKYLRIHNKAATKDTVNCSKKEENQEYWLDTLNDELCERYRRVSIFFEGSKLIIKTGINTYNAHMWNRKDDNILRISGILSSKEYDQFLSHRSSFEKQIGLSIELHNGGERHYDTIWGQNKNPFKSIYLYDVISEEADEIAESIKKFILFVDIKKQEIR